MGCTGSGAAQKFESEIEEAQAKQAALSQEVEEAERRLHEVRAGSHDEMLDQLHAELLQSEDHRSQEFPELLELRRRNEALMHTEQELYTEFMQQTSSPAVGSRAEPATHSDARSSCDEHLRNAVHRYREETMASEKQLVPLQEQLITLRHEHSQAVAELQDAHAKTQADGSGQDCSGTASMERLLAEKRGDYERAHQRWNDTEKLLHEQMKELRNELSIQEQKLRKQDGDMQDRDKELAEVNHNLGNLQSLFDDVNQQLQTECGRIEELQATVELCAKQGKELESLQSMLEESHRVLVQMRDALEFERSERAVAAQALEQEQHRTQLLLDVLKHFKEKLQGLTPQMLLNRFNGDSKASHVLDDPSHFSNSDIQKPLLRKQGEHNGSGNNLYNQFHDPYLGARLTPSSSRHTLGDPELAYRSSRALVSPRYPLSDGTLPAMLPQSSSFPNLMQANGNGMPMYSSGWSLRK